MNIIIDRLRRTKRKDKWIFTVISSDNGKGFMRSHGWHYSEESDRITRPTAATFKGPMADVDEQTLENIKTLIKDEIDAIGQPLPMRSIFTTLTNLYALHGDWDIVVEAIKADISHYDGKEPLPQWVAYCTASILAKFEADEVPEEVVMKKAS